MFHSVKQHGPASVNCSEMGQKLVLRSDIFSRNTVLFTGPTIYSDFVPWLIFSFSVSIADGSQHSSVGSRF